MEVGLQSDHQSRDGVEVLGIGNTPIDLHGVDAVAGGESEDIAAHGILLRVVADGVAEVKGVGSGVDEVFLHLYGYFLADGFHDRRHLLRRRDKQILLDVIELQILVEGNLYLLSMEVDRLVQRLLFHHPRGDSVFRSSLRSNPSVGTRREKQQQE